MLGCMRRTNELLESDIWVCGVWADAADSGQVTHTFIINQQFRIQEIMFTHSPLPQIITGPANLNPLPSGQRSPACSF